MDNDRKATDDGAAFGRWLAARREAAHLSQQELAQSAGVSTRTVQRWEAGAEKPLEVVRVLSALGVDLDAAPAAARALNAQVGQIERLLDELSTRIHQGEAQPGDLLARREMEGVRSSLRSLEERLDVAAQDTAEALDRLASAIDGLSARIPDEVPGTRRRRTAGR